MLKRHEDVLFRRLDELVGRGWAFIAWWELYQWYEAERLGRNTWRDLIARLEEAGLTDAFLQELDEGILLLTSRQVTSIRTKI